jgi:hypothetical protein
MATDLRSLKLIDFCTPSIAYDRQVQAGCVAFDNQMHDIIDVTDGVVPIAVGDQLTPAQLSAIIFIPQILALLDETLVDILAWQFHVDFYDATKPLEFKRQLVQDSIQWHMRKGTVQLVQDVLDMFWPGGATLIEWYQYMVPLPPNYPIDNNDILVGSITPANVNVSTGVITLNAHGLVNSAQVHFETLFASASQPPAPMLPGVLYRVDSATTNTFKVATQLGDAPMELMSPGAGTTQVYRRPPTGGSWHDRYRFRVIIDKNIILPEDEAQVLALINAYKPVSRWLEGIFRMESSECAIGWCGACLQFIYIMSEAPDYP